RVYRAADAPPPPHPVVRGVDDGVHLLGGDVALHHGHVHAAHSLSSRSTARSSAACRASAVLYVRRVTDSIVLPSSNASTTRGSTYADRASVGVLPRNSETSFIAATTARLRAVLVAGSPADAREAGAITGALHARNSI